MSDKSIAAAANSLKQALDQVGELLNKASAKPSRLKPILSPDSKFSFAWRPAGLDQVTLFPLPPDQIIDDVAGLKSTLTQRRRQGATNPLDQIEHDLETLRAVAGCLPGKTPGVSVYHEARLAAAWEGCRAEPDPQGAVAAYLVGGDLSGIQSFIYTLTSKRAAKTLRGRSFYLQLLTEAVMRLALRTFGLSAAQVLYSGGGHFFLLVPATAAAHFDELRQRISEVILAHHGTALYLSLAWAPVTSAQVAAGSVGEAWAALQRNLRQAKQHRYTELGPDLYGRLFELGEHSGNADHVCAVCGEERAQGQELPDDEDAGVQIYVCATCASLAADIGAPLANADWLEFGIGAPHQAHGLEGALAVLGDFGLLLQYPPPIKVDQRVRWSFTDQDWEGHQATDGRVCVRRYVTNVRLNETLREFSGLIGEAHGIQRLGVLRADVDDAGPLFRAASASQGASLERLMAMSAALSAYFEGWVGNLARKVRTDKGEPVIYSVYSGGDDLFLIGPWDRMPKLVLDIVRDFDAYSGGRGHLSAGLALIEAKYPVYQAAEDAEEALQRAKAQPGKNAFGFLGEAYDWQTFERIDGHHQSLVTLTKDGKYGRALLATLRQSGLDAQAQRRADARLIVGPWLWRTVYQLKRAEERTASKDTELKTLCEQMRAELPNDNYSGIFHLSMAARWAQLSLRESKGSNSDLGA